MAWIAINRNLCKGCGLCAEFCPRGIITRGTGFNALGFSPFEADPRGGCTGCGACALMCPDGAVEIRPDGENGGLSG